MWDPKHQFVIVGVEIEMDQATFPAFPADPSSPEWSLGLGVLKVIFVIVNVDTYVINNLKKNSFFAMKQSETSV